MQVRRQLWKGQSSGLSSIEFGGALGIRKGCSWEAGQLWAEKGKEGQGIWSKSNRT